MKCFIILPLVLVLGVFVSFDGLRAEDPPTSQEKVEGETAQAKAIKANFDKLLFGDKDLKKEALDYFRAVDWKFTPEVPLFKSLLQDKEYRVRAISAYALGKIGVGAMGGLGAFREVEKLLTDSSPAVQKYARKALDSFSAIDQDEAIEEFSKAINQKSHLSIAHLLRGRLYSFKGENAKALEDLNRAIRLDPNSAEAYFCRSVVWQLRLDYDKQVEDLGEVIRLRQDDPLAYEARGMAYSDKGEFGNAVQDFSQVIRLRPDDHYAYSERARAYEAKGDRYLLHLHLLQFQGKLSSGRLPRHHYRYHSQKNQYLYLQFQIHLL